MSSHPPPRTYSPPDLFTASGIGQVVVVRFKSGGRIEIGVFLVDVYCLGVKNAFFLAIHEGELERFLKDAFRTSHEPPEEHSGAWGRKLVENAVAYAKGLGFAPHRHYNQAARVFGGIDPKECAEEFTFGYQGKPLFIAGPNDSQEKCRIIIKKLERRCGPGGSNFMVPVSEEDAEKLREFTEEP